MSQSQDPKRRVVLVPTRDDLVDAGFVVALMLLALVGLRTTYAGSAYLIVGLAGALLGLAIGYLAGVLRQPMIAVAAATLVVFFLAGGAVALRSTAIAWIVPSGSTFHGLADESVHGWKYLLTTLPPVTGDGPLLVLPYLLGILGGVGGFCLARRTATALFPVLAPLLVLVAVILLGTTSPAARLLQGGVFGVVALGWSAVRSQRRRPIQRSGSGAAFRVGTVLGLLAVAGVVGSLTGPHMPGLQAASRTVLRNDVTPPTDLDRFPSPLAGFRKYKQPAVKNTVLMRVSGLPKNTALRIAILDQYNGSVWSASNDPGTLDAGVEDVFQQVGDSIPTHQRGRRVSYTVDLPTGGYSDVWLPTAGYTSRVEFTGPDAGADTGSLRYNLATGTGLVLDGLRYGDRYNATGVLPSESVPADATTAPGNDQLEQESAFVSAKAQSLGGNAGSPLARLTKIEQVLRAGYYSDGIKPGQQQYLPGHYQSLMQQFLDNSQLVGDDEQYASALALMANSPSIGIPARVVIGAFPHNDVVKGSDVRAWVQIELADRTWRDILPKQFIPATSRTPRQQPPPVQPKTMGQKVPPPVATHPKGDQLDSSAVNSKTSRDHKKRHVAAAGGLPAWILTLGRDVGLPIVVILLILGSIVGGKTLRRRRRRTRGAPALRLARGWTEVLDHARDLGTRVPGAITRREQAVLLGLDDLRGLAESADARVFGAAEPQEADAAEFWTEVAASRKRMSRSVGRRQRWTAAVNPASFRRSRGLLGSAT